MNFTINTFAKALADYLESPLPGVTFYEDPNQQKSAMPCAFLQQRFATLEKRQAGRWLRTIGLDLTYLEDFNLPDLQRRYQAAAEALDLVMETIPYTANDPKESVLLRTYEREWRIDLDALHYKFELRIWVTLPEAVALMRTMSYTGVLKNGKSESED